MRDWEKRILEDEATVLNGEGVIVNNASSEEVLDNCKAIGRMSAGN